MVVGIKHRYPNCAVKLASTLAALLLSFSANGADFSRSDATLRTLSLRQKIAQMMIVDVKVSGPDPNTRAISHAAGFGGVILFKYNLRNRSESLALIQSLQRQAQSLHGIPLLIMLDQEGGAVNRLEHVVTYGSLQIGARTFAELYRRDRSEALAELAAIATRVAQELKALGVNLNLAPVLDVTDDPNAFIFQRSFGGDPASVVEMAGLYADILEQHGILTAGKHFPNLASTRGDSHKELPVLSRTLDELRGYEFMPFRRLARRVSAMMVGHIMVPKVDPLHPASLSVPLLSLLRKELGFNGAIIADDLKMKALTDRFSFEESVIQAVTAGIDVFLVAWKKGNQREMIAVIEAAVRAGRISEARIDEAVGRVLSLKQKHF